MAKSESTNILVEIRDAYKQYNPKAVILRGLQMTVERGTIYGLLGASGCGKTTLLRCLAGSLTLDSGSITAKVEGKSQLGYMPQDIALVDAFTVIEMFKYFGHVHGIPSSMVATRGQELLRMLDLSPDIFLERVIANTSGGQQRRISLAVTLLHDPALLVLDEPTVGLDPVLTESIWEYFIDITEQKGKTIIITTHYIEEARKAHMVGLMRGGVLLAECPPTKLLMDHKSDTLEEVFLILSEKQTNGGEQEDKHPAKNYIQTSVEKPFKDSVNAWNRQRMMAQIFKNICWAKRNVPMLTFMLVLPAFMTWIFCGMVLDQLNYSVISVVNEDVLDSCLHPSVPQALLPACTPQSRYSCQFTRTMKYDKGYDVKEYHDFYEAMRTLEKGPSRAVIHFKQNYTWSVIRRLSDGLTTPDRYLESSEMDVYLDKAEVTLGFKIKRDIADSFSNLLKHITEDCGYNERSVEQVLQFETPIYGQSEPTFSETSMPGYLIPVLFYFTSYFSASSIASEKFSGFLDRCLISGVRRRELVIAHTVIQVLMVTGQNILVLIIAYGLFSLPIRGSWAMLILVIGLTEFQGMVYGFLIGTVLETEKNISYMSIGTVLVIFLSCGLLWPIEGAHRVLYPLLHYSPINMAVESYRSVTLRGWGLENNRVTVSVLVNAGLAIFLSVVFVIASKLKR